MDVAKWEDLFRPYSVFGGELLITKLGEPPGVCAIYPEGIGPAMVTPDVVKMTPNARAALPQFLMHYFNSQIARDFGTLRQALRSKQRAFGSRFPFSVKCQCHFPRWPSKRE